MDSVCGKLKSEKMMAIVIDGCLGPESLQSSSEAVPCAKCDEVVIWVFAVGVNKLDVRRTYASFALEKHWTQIPGLECTGTIIHIGARLRNWKIGQKVCALLNGGGYAEAVAVPAAQVFPYVDSMPPMDYAACLPHAVCLAWESLRAAKLSEGMSILVYSSCGLIGEMVVQRAKMLNAKVIVASPGAIWALRDKADHIIDSKSSGFLKLVLEATPQGVDIVLDSGMSNFVNNVKYLKQGGSIVNVDNIEKEKVNVSFSELVSKSATFLVIDRRAWTPEYTAIVVKGVKKDLWPYIESGEISVRAPKSISIHNVAEAHRCFEKYVVNSIVLLTG